MASVARPVHVETLPGAVATFVIVVMLTHVDATSTNYGPVLQGKRASTRP